MSNPRWNLTGELAMRRREKLEFLRERIDLTGEGLELGPNVNPMFRKSQGFRVNYLETRSTEELRQSMLAVGRDPALVEEIDFVLDRGRTLAENTSGKMFEWVASSHVLEHIPDFVGHLAQVASVLKQWGVYAAIVPDRNLCFDCLKPQASLGEVLQAYMECRQLPSLASNIDELRYGVRPEGIKVGGWTIEDANANLVPKHPGWASRVRAILKAGNNERRPDLWVGHSWRFDPASFSHILADLGRLDLTPLQLIELKPTYNMDFIAILRKQPIDVTAMDRITQTVVSSYHPPQYRSVVKNDPNQSSLL